MDSYFDIQVRSIENTPLATVINAVFSRLHVLLVERGTGDIGVSFPEARTTTGSILRLHGSSAALQHLLPQFVRFNDYCRFSSVKPVPPRHDWYRINRIQPKMSAAKIRRLVRRGSLSKQDAVLVQEKTLPLTSPYLQLKSQSTGQPFRLFIDQQQADAPSATQQFNTYGLGGVIPWF